MKKRDSLNMLNNVTAYEKVHTTFCKQILRVTKRSNIPVKLELGRMPLIYNIIKQIVKFYCRLQLMSNDRLLKQIYNVTANVSYNINNAVNYVCDFLGLSLSEFNFENVQYENYFVNQVMTSLTDLYNDEWYTCINDDNNDTKNKLKF